VYSPGLHQLLVQARIQELHRSGQTRNSDPITTMGRAATGRRRRRQLFIYLSRAIGRFVGHAAPEAYAF
jgi:hypothetical protein